MGGIVPGRHNTRTRTFKSVVFPEPDAPITAVSRAGSKTPLRVHCCAIRCVSHGAWLTRWVTKTSRKGWQAAVSSYP